MDKLIASAKQLGRHGLRDSTMILIAYRHELRVSELISLRWSQIDLKQGLLHVIRKKMESQPVTLFLAQRFGLCVN